MALLMSLILGSGLAAFTSNTTFSQNDGYENEIHTTTTTADILIRHMAIIRVPT